MTDSEKQRLINKMVDASEGRGPQLTDAELAQLPEITAELDAQIAVDKVNDDVKFFATYIFTDHADPPGLATKLVMNPRARVQLLAWVFTEELKDYPDTSAPVAALYVRLLAGDAPTDEEWAEAAHPARELSIANSRAVTQEAPLNKPHVMAAWAATEPRNLVGAIQAAALHVGSREATPAGVLAASALFNQRVTAKVLELLAASAP
jgi:hypothetical protein